MLEVEVGDHCGLTANDSLVLEGYSHWVEMVMVVVAEVLEDVSQLIISLATFTVIGHLPMVVFLHLNLVAQELFSSMALHLWTQTYELITKEDKQR